MKIFERACRPLAADIPAVLHSQQQTPVLSLWPIKRKKDTFWSKINQSCPAVHCACCTQAFKWAFFGAWTRKAWCRTESLLKRFPIFLPALPSPSKMYRIPMKEGHSWKYFKTFTFSIGTKSHLDFLFFFFLVFWKFWVISKRCWWTDTPTVSWY